MRTHHAHPTPSEDTRARADEAVGALRALVARTPGGQPSHELVSAACREAGVTREVLHLLDSSPGLWGYEADWHACLRRLRNNASRELLERACGLG